MPLDQSPEARSARRERLKKLLADPETMETIYDHIGSGGTILSLCETWDVRYVDIMRHIDADEARQKKYRDAIVARNEWSDEMLLAEVRSLAKGLDIRKLYNQDNTLKDIKDLDSATAYMVSSIESNDIFEGRGAERTKIGESKKIKLWDKLKALEMAMKNRRLLIDKSESEVSVKLEDLVGRSMDGAPPAPAVPAPTKTDAAPGSAPATAASGPLPAPAEKVTAPAAAPETPAP